MHHCYMSTCFAFAEGQSLVTEIASGVGPAMSGIATILVWFIQQTRCVHVRQAHLASSDCSDRICVGVRALTMPPTLQRIVNDPRIFKAYLIDILKTYFAFGHLDT